MKSIDKTLERAQIYAQSVIDSFGTSGVPIGIKDIKKMLAEAYLVSLSEQWRGTSDTPPIDEDVLVDYPYEHGYAVTYYDGEDWYLTETGKLLRPTRWMSIPPHNKTKENE